MDQYPWYERVVKSDAILQGDIIVGCSIVVPTEKIEEGVVPARILEYDVVVMSQSCDLVNDKLELVLVCPIWPLSTMQKKDSYFESKDGKNNLLQGSLPGYHLLNKCELEGFESEHIVVDFRSVFSVHINTLKNICELREKRLRLLPPYREHLAQAFARFFMRVGLPVDIEPI